MSGHVAMLLPCLPLVAAVAGWAAERTGLPYPVLLVVAGSLLGLSSVVATPELSPQVMFFVFLPPLLYYAAFFSAPRDLRANATPIGLLAVGLVLVTMAAVAGVMVGVAGVPPGVAAVVGAVVAPTDAVAATAVFRRLNVPERLVTIVEGEGLVNDGSALVLYASAVAAVVTGALGPGEIAMALLAAPLGGALLGFAIAWVLVWVRRRIDQPLVEITLSLSTPYLTYVTAQIAGLSGILATVVAGVYVGSRTGVIYTAGGRLQAFAFLDVLVFVLNGVLFTLLGMQLVRVVRAIPDLAIETVMAAMIAVIAAVMGSRLVWMLLGPAAARLLGRAGQPAGWRERIVIGWAGMRGGVSLAAALAVPLRRADGSPFPDRELVVVVTAGVIVATLMLQGTSLPWLLRHLGIGHEDLQSQQRLARLQAARAALAWLDDYAATERVDDAVESLRALYGARVRRLQGANQDQPSRATSGADELQRYRELQLRLLGVERSTVIELRQQGRISATVRRAIERILDLEEARILGL
ncbi:Na+/H+ antiporter [Mycobacterium sp. SM1]|uniref:Na+/H+ antiporter n=1 Tax=Mycobacterium sp. SM1 TaxID=2816243 RepID=UPI001BCD8F89|nr:Na+/H+ antiporter [Mycobacterium sp. SM1]MBS4729298.1 Na+/H+ antiporter [Mycobacterium sp. SM1]